MSQNLNDKGQTMAKQQRSVQLPAEIYDFCEKIEERTGLKFNRLVLAAILSFFFESMKPIDADWISTAISLEKGKINLSEVPKHKHGEYAKSVRRQMEYFKSKKASKETLAKFEAIADKAESESGTWSGLVASHGDDIEALVATILSDMYMFAKIGMVELPDEE